VVEFRSRADMERAIATMSQTVLDGRKIFVKEVGVSAVFF
jgi:RNA recognition motif-containing protein